VPELAPHYLIEVTREGNLDAMSVAVELQPQAAALAGDRREAVARQLQHLVKTYVGISVKVEVGAPLSLERSQGKARHVIDKRPKST
jgi:phenylacetate-CoA ligase